MKICFVYCFQLSYGSASPDLGNRDIYRRFFRVIPNANIHNGPRIKVMDLFNWKRVATINYADNYFSLVRK